MKNKILFIVIQCVKKESQDLACQYERLFPTELTRDLSMNIIKVISCIFQQCLGMFAMLLVEGSSKTKLFRHLSNHVLEVINFGNTKPMMVIFLFKSFKFWETFQKCSKKSRKKFFVSQVIACELVSLNCPYEKQDSSHRQPKC